MYSEGKLRFELLSDFRDTFAMSGVSRQWQVPPHTTANA